MFPVLGLEFTWFLLAPIHFPLYWRRLWLKSHMMGLFDAEIVCFLSLRSSERLMVFFGKVFRQKCQEGDMIYYAVWLQVVWLLSRCFHPKPWNCHRSPAGNSLTTTTLEPKGWPSTGLNPSMQISSAAAAQNVEKISNPLEGNLFASGLCILHWKHSFDSKPYTNLYLAVWQDITSK